MITYRQTDGQITLDGKEIGHGYSGHGVGLNNPDMESVARVGPIPRGAWKIERWDDHHSDKGPCVAVLQPLSDVHGRSAFLIHGDNSFENHTASDGCIVANHTIRDMLRQSGETELTVGR